MINTLHLPFYPLLPPVFVRLEAYAVAQRSQGGLIYQTKTALPTKESDIDNDCLGEVRDDGRFVLATHLNCRTDLNNFIRNFHPLCMTFAAASSDEISWLVS